MVNLMFGPSGVSIMSMDTSKISLIRLILTPLFFEEYRCTEPVVLGIYTETLTNILQKAKQSTLHWEATDEDALSIVFADQDFKTEFQMRAIQIDDDQLVIPEMQDDIAFEVETSVLQGWVDKVLLTKSEIAFDITEKCFVCSSTSPELGEIKHTEPIGGDRIRLSSFRENVTIKLSNHATKSMAVFASVGGGTCLVGFSNQQPSRIRVHLDETSTLCLYVAPKITE